MILTIAGNEIITGNKNELMLESEKYAEEINIWIQEERMIVEAVARNIEIQKSTDEKFLSDLVYGYAADRTELQNLYVGTAEGVFIKTIEGETFEGYNPVERSWYQQAAESGDTIMMNPYIDAVTGQMCASFATPVYFDEKLVAVVGSDVSLDKVSELVEQIDYSEDAYGFLIDSDGNYIVHENKEFRPSAEGTTVFTDIVPELNGMEGKVVRAEDYDGTLNYFAVTELMGGGWCLGVTIPSFNVVSALYVVLVISFLIQVFAIVFCVFIIRRLTNRLLAPIQTLKSFASGDFSENAVIDKEIPDEYKDESEQITIATAKVKDQIRGIILETKQEAESIGCISAKISEIVKDVSQQTQEADSVTEKIHISGKEIVQVVDNISEKAVDLTKQSNDIMTRAKNLYSASQKSSCKTAGLYADVKKKLEEAIEDSKKIDKIHGLAEDILSISSQTNILAMNASVAAARAGKAGKEFAVLAREIRVLADNSGNIADNITNVVNTIIDSVNRLAKQSNSLLDFVNKDVMADYQQMISISGQYEDDASFFCKVSTDLSTSSEEMNSVIVNINEAINVIAGLVSNISDGMKVIEKTAAGADEQTDMESLVELSVSLNETVSAFKV